MTPKDLAVKDMKEDLSKENKSFLAFHKELNPAIRNLEREQIKEQLKLSSCFAQLKTNYQLVARCFYDNNTVTFENLIHYYGKK